MLYISMLCIAYIIGIIWGLFLTKVGYSPFIFLIIAVLIYFKKFPQFDKTTIIKFAILVVLLLLGFINLRIRINIFENEYVNKSRSQFSGYIDRKISDNKYLFTNEDNHKFIIYNNNENIKEDLEISFIGSFIKPSHTRNHSRI